MKWKGRRIIEGGEGGSEEGKRPETKRGVRAVSDTDPPIVLARDGARPTSAGDADDAEPLAKGASGLERAVAVLRGTKR